MRNEDFDSDNYHEFTLECRVCSRSTMRRNATHLLSTVYWEFFYCYNCDSWFQMSIRNSSVVFKVEDRRMIGALNHLTQAMESMNYSQDWAETFRKILRKIGDLIDRLLSPYMVDEPY